MIRILLYQVLFTTFLIPSLKARFSSIDCLISTAINQRVFPGAQVLVYHKGSIVYHKAFGHYTYDKNSPVITNDTLFDLASVTKIFTIVAAMMLYDEGLISIDDPVCKYISLFKNKPKKNIRIKHLLTHTSGIPCERFFEQSKTEQESFNALESLKFGNNPGENHIYTCANIIILQKIIEKITGESLAKFIANRITEPLGMENTFFNPHNKYECAPTEDEIWGIVQDRQSYALGGIAGNAGLFSTAKDLEIFINALMQGFLVRKKTMQLWTSEKAFGWGYGWEIGRHLSEKSFGHFGWTGTSVWADAEHDVICIFLTNRTMTGSQEGNLAIRGVRVALHELVVSLLGLPAYKTPPVPAF